MSSRSNIQHGNILYVVLSNDRIVYMMLPYLCWFESSNIHRIPVRSLRRRRSDLIFRRHLHAIFSIVFLYKKRFVFVHYSSLSSFFLPDVSYFVSCFLFFVFRFSLSLSLSFLSFLCLVNFPLLYFFSRREKRDDRDGRRESI